MNTYSSQRVVSGMRPTGRLHLGHYQGVLKNWSRLQHEHECYFFVADWHALTTALDTTETIEGNAYEMIVDWLAAGISPESATIFVQSKVPEHAELSLLLSMVTPVSWLERVPTYKDQLKRLNDKDLNSYGFLGYPVLQAADILAYRAGLVPVGEDQRAHVELCREIASRFNESFGTEPDFVATAERAIDSLDDKQAEAYRAARRDYIEKGDPEARNIGRAVLDAQQVLSIRDRERLLGYLDGNLRRVILPEPQEEIVHSKVVTGLDGAKMSKSYDNAIYLRESAESVTKKIRTMQTDPARVRRSDPGTPEKCPVYSLHNLYLDAKDREWAADGCRNATIGCIDCKKPLIDAINAEQEEFRNRAQPFLDEPGEVRRILMEGSERAREEAKETLEDVRLNIGISYRTQ